MPLQFGRTLLIAGIGVAFAGAFLVGRAIAQNLSDQETGPVQHGGQTIEEMEGTSVTDDAASTDDIDGAVDVQIDENGHVVVPPATEKAMRYYHSGNGLWAFSTLYGFAVPLVILFTGFSAILRNWARRFSKGWWLEVVVYLLLFTAITFLLNLPLDYYSGYVRQHAYDLSNQSFGKWFGDELKGFAVGMILTALVMWVPYALIRKFPRTWWAWFSAGSLPFILLFMLIQPIWIAPLFNKFGPMKDKTLEAKILNLAETAGIQGGRVFEVDKSVDTRAVNAYVTGFAGSKRIVLWDTLLKKLKEDEVLFVMGHEMGHYKLGHVYQMIGLAVVMVFAGMFTVHRTSGWFIRKFKHRFGFDGMGDIASYPLLILLFSLVAFVLQPGMMAFSRHNERVADKFGLEITRDNQAAAAAFVKLQHENLGNPYPGPLYTFFRASHPPIGDRVEFINQYRPWSTGEKLQYEHYFNRGRPQE
ncbi:M48 family metalloprotease [bacterium]|nr:M48 family metalloprotease [bacterium]